MTRSASLLFGVALACVATSAASAATTGKVGYYTYHYDNYRTGWNSHETALNASSVSAKRFGLVRTFATDSVVYAQPLYVPSVVVDNVIRNIVIIATENDSVFAYDADDGALAWRRSFVSPARGITAVSTQSVGGCNQITPTIGISSTPVIDPATKILYVVDKIAVRAAGGTTYHNQVHALNLRNGADVRNPVEVEGTVHIRGGGTDAFVPRWEQNRAGLVLANRNVYVGFGSSCDENGSVTHGWLFAYNENTLKNTAIFNTTTTDASSYLGSIWQATYAPAVDAAGNIFVATGNGVFDANRGGTDFGESVLRLAPALTVTDYFSPSDELAQSNADQDIGSDGVMLIPGTNPELAVAGIKSGTMYLLDGANLGRFHSGGDRVLQEIALGPGANSLYGGPAYYPGFVYWGAGGQRLKAFALSGAQRPRLTLASQTTNVFTGEGGEIPAISSDGTKRGTAVVWATTRPERGGAISLYAYDASDLARTLFVGRVGTWEAQGDAFLTPTVADGHVFVGGAGYGVAEFGLR